MELPDNAHPIRNSGDRFVAFIARNGRVTSLKAAHRKLSRLYLDQRAAEQVA
jgi:hypothetical protein